MSQWGTTRRFGRGGTRIRVLPDVGKPFEPLDDKAEIADLYLLDIDFIPEHDREIQRKRAEQMLAELKREYVGRPDHEWTEPVTVL